MPQKYKRSDLQKMNLGELSQLIGYDYNAFMAAGGKPSDVLKIANGKKSLRDVIPDAEISESAGISDERLYVIRRRRTPALTVVLSMFVFVIFIFVFYAVVSALNVPDFVVLILAFMLPIAFVWWRSRQALRGK